MTAPARRTTVAHPQTLAAMRRRGRQQHRAAPPVEAADDELGMLLLRTLMRAQLSLALRLAAVFGCLLGGLPLLLAESPAVRQEQVFGLALPWLLLGVVMSPLLLAGGVLYVRLAERNEADYLDLVDRT